VARHHWREGLIACAVASGLWVQTMTGASLDQSSQAIPVVIENLPAGYRVAGIDPPEIDVIFEGRKHDLAKAGGDRLQVRVDGDLARLGRRTFVIDEEQVEHPPELQIVAFEPAQIRLAIEPR
jgi:hypothetical protein